MSIQLSILGFLITMSRKEVSGGDDGPGPEPIPLNSKLWCFFLFPLIMFIMPFNTDVGVVINDYHCHLRGVGGGVFMTFM